MPVKRRDGFIFESSVSDTIHEVAHAITVVGGYKRWVAFPETTDAKERTKAALARLVRIPGVLGCVDGTLIAIQKPHGLSPAHTANYMLRKGFCALNTMILAVFSSAHGNCPYRLGGRTRRRYFGHRAPTPALGSSRDHNVNWT
ncbi:hypothetical protein MTO96_018033 [Rhipicephalus appendiculatus]